MRKTATVQHATLLLFTAFLTLAGCSGGGGSDAVQTAPDTTAVALHNATILYSGRPRINEALTLSVRQPADEQQTYSWSVVSAPDSNNLGLTPTADNTGVTLTPTLPGEYRLRVSGDAGSATTHFFIAERLPFLSDKIAMYEGSFAEDNYVGRVTNQVWLHSRTRDQSSLEQLAARYPTFQVMGYDTVSGLLLQFDESVAANRAAVRDMKLESGITSVVYRVVSGQAYIDEADVTPDDGSRFDDGGDNWHLERIGAEQAWDITTGSDNILIGISEPKEKFFINHEDLAGRFAIAAQASEGDSSHPSAVAGALGAITDNGIGMSGINWVSRLSTGDSGEDELRRLAGSGSTKVINSSWSLLSSPDEGTDISDPAVADAREQTAFERTRNYRKLMQSFPNHLFVNSAGNGVKGEDGTAIDGRFHSSALHYDDIGSFQPVSNVLFVAAMEEDGRLRESSNYGESVEIAAPAGYKSIAGAEGYRTFNATSAATPVVSGVASLIYSVDPNFSAHTVKSILLSTATEFVSERHTEPGNDGATEPLAQRIPVVNAEKALQLAEALAAGLKAEVVQTIDNPFQNATDVQVRSATGRWETVSFSYLYNGVQGTATREEIKLSLDNPGLPLTLISNDVKFLNRGLGTTSIGLFDVSLENPHIALNLYNRESSLPVGNAQITIEPVNVFNARFDSATGSADASGQTRVYLMSGVYRVIVDAVGFDRSSTLVNIVNEGERIVVNLPLTLSTAPPDPAGTTQDACLVGKWTLDMAHYQQQLDQTDAGFIVSGEGLARMVPDGTGTLDLDLVYTSAADGQDEQPFITTITQDSQYKYRWSTDGNVYFGDLQGSTENVVSVVTVDGLTFPVQAEPPESGNGPTDGRLPYTCQADVWLMEATEESNVAVRFTRQ